MHGQRWEPAEQGRQLGSGGSSGLLGEDMQLPMIMRMQATRAAAAAAAVHNCCLPGGPFGGRPAAIHYCLAPPAAAVPPQWQMTAVG